MLKNKVVNITEGNMSSIVENSEALKYALSSVFSTVYNINIAEDTVNPIISSEYASDNIPAGCPYSVARNAVVNSIAREEWRDIMDEFTDPETLEERIKKNGKISVEYETVKDGWRRQTYIPYKNDPETGKLIEVLYLSEKIDSEKRKELEREKQLEIAMSINNSFAEVYFCSFYVDIMADHFECLSAPIHVLAVTGKSGKASTGLAVSSKAFFNDVYENKIEVFNNMNTLSERLANTNSIYEDYLGNITGWCRVTFICARRNEYGQATHVIYAIQSINKEKTMELERQHQLEKQLAISKSLSDIYYSAHYLDLLNNEFSELTSANIIRQVLGSSGRISDCMNKVATMFTTPDYIRQMLEFTDISTLNERMKHVDVIYNEFLGTVNGWCRAGYIAAKRDRDGDLTHVIFTVQIIDKEKQKELDLITDLQNAVEKSNKATRAKSDFLSHMSHEIRTPINAILGMNEMIIRDSEDKKILDYAATISDSGQALLAIINDVLDFSKIESGKFEIVNNEYQLSSLINDCYHMVVERAKKKNLGFKVKCDETIPANLIGDVNRVRQITINLLTNAIKYSDEGEVIFNVSRWDIDGTFYLRISVTDTGIGMSQEDKERLFGKFERFNLSRNQSVEGTGLGLAITKNLVDLMKGSIEVESEYGKGSTFTVTIPQGVIEGPSIGTLNFEHSIKDIKKRKSEDRFSAPGKTALVVDDMATNLKVIVKLLEKSRMVIDTSLSGAQAIDMCKTKKYDIILMDHMMPGMNGIDAMKAIKNDDSGLNKETPVIMLTANALGGMKEQYMLMGFSEYISKPVKPSVLEETLRMFLTNE